MAGSTMGNFADAETIIEARDDVIEAFEQEWDEKPRTVTVDIWDDGDAAAEAFTTDRIEEGGAVRRVATHVDGGVNSDDKIRIGTFCVREKTSYPVND